MEQANISKPILFVEDDVLLQSSDAMCCLMCGEECIDYNAMCVNCGRSPHKLIKKTDVEKFKKILR